jgi:2-polyprenyl-6-methoxyphenol hydroxylase-like FAD-dependent oxidoreductase
LLHQRVLSHGAPIQRLYGENASGRVVLDLNYADLSPELFGLGIRRGAVFAALWDEVCTHAGIVVRSGMSVSAILETQDCISLRCTDDSLHSFDRVVVASGARSEFRPPGSKVTAYPWGALWTVAESNVSPGTLSQRYRDTREMAGLLPSGDGTVSVFWSLRTDALEAWKKTGLSAWKEQVHRLMPQVPLDHVHEPEQVLFAPYFDVSAPHWHTDRCVWLGDVAHAMSPQLGQGANLALVDAWTLAEVFAEGAPLSEYSRRRRDHVRFYSWASYFLTPFFQSSFPILAPLRDLGSPVFHHWPWYRRRMVEALCGAKTGIFGEDATLRRL